MTSRAKKAAAKEVVTLVANPSQQPGTLKKIGGSASDDWNNTLANQTDPPPLKWSDSKYGFRPEEDHDAEEDTQG